VRLLPGSIPFVASANPRKLGEKANTTGNPSPGGYNHFFHLHSELLSVVSPEEVHDRLCLRFLPEEALGQG
jgi:hypothetical protein